MSRSRFVNGLYSRSYGSGQAHLVILHGLFGSGRNWHSVARALASQHLQVHCLDQRNHGNSSHFASHTLSDLVDDLKSWIESCRLNNAMLLGHSMGGMAAMACALTHPETVGALIVVDIAPRPYPPHHQKEFAALEVDVSDLQSRQAIDTAMQAIQPDEAVRQFLMMNVSKEPDGRYAWKLNVPVLKQAAFTARAVFQGAYQGPCLFIRGAQSNYITDADGAVIQTHFPKASIATIPAAGHWLHHTHQPDFIRRIMSWMQSQADFKILAEPGLQFDMDL